MRFDVPLGKPVGLSSALAPDGRMLQGRFVRVEKLNAAAHGAALWACAKIEPTDRWAYLGDAGPFGAGERAAFDAMIASHAASKDPFFYAILPGGGPAKGFASLMRHDLPNRVIETGWIWLSAAMARSPASTEAMFLLMQHAFDDLGMRRYEWKCNALNAPSRAAAERLGFTFEGTFRQHQISRGLNRDTAWYSVLDGEWPRVKAGFEAWLDPRNFDAEDQQRHSLLSLREMN